MKANISMCLWKKFKSEKKENKHSLNVCLIRFNVNFGFDLKKKKTILLKEFKKKELYINM